MIQTETVKGGILHALYSLRAEGCPRLAFDLLTQDLTQRGRCGSVTVLDPQDDLRDDFERVGIPIHQLTWKRRNYLSIYRQFLDVLEREKPAGVVLYPLGAHIPMTWACQRLSIPHVVHVACLPPWRDYAALQKLRLQMGIGNLSTAAYAACSERVRLDAIKAYRLPAQRIQTIYNGINIERFSQLRSTRAAWNSDIDRPLNVGMTGSLEQSKDHPTLLRAVALLHQENKRLLLHIIGGGSEEHNLKKLAKELGIADIVRWTGSIRDVPAELAKLDVYAFSAKPEEGLGIALIEAMASGLPLLATDIPAVREIFRDYPEGVTVPFGDSKAMAKGIWQAKDRQPATIEMLHRFSVDATYLQYAQLLDRHLPIPITRISR